jgi:hypothetical protein
MKVSPIKTRIFISKIYPVRGREKIGESEKPYINTHRNREDGKMNAKVLLENFSSCFSNGRSGISFKDVYSVIRFHIQPFFNSA